MIDKKKRVLIVHNYYQIPGGEDTVVANEKKMLEENGHYVLVYSRSNEELKRMSKIQKLMLPFTIIFNIRTYREIKKIIQKQKIDIVHVHNTLNLISPAVYYAAEKCRVPVIQTIHNFRLLCPGATFYRDGHICEDCVEQGLWCAVKHKCYRNSRLQTLACVINTKIHRITGIYGKLNYICLTEFNKKKLLMLKQIREETVFVKPNFVKEISEIMPFEERKNQIIYAGRLDRLKGIDFLLKTWKKIETPICKLLIYGTGDMMAWCEGYIHENKLENIELKGFIENHQLQQIIGESRALILPTQWYEGFPMSMVEAFSRGTPVLGTDIGNVGDLLLDGVNGKSYCLRDEKSFIEALQEIQTQDFVESTFEFFQKYYTEKQNYEEIIAIYDNCH